MCPLLCFHQCLLASVLFPFLSLFLDFSPTSLLSSAGHIYLPLFSTISLLCSCNLALDPCFIEQIVSLFYLNSWWNVWWQFFVVWKHFSGECSFYLPPSFYLDGIFVEILYLFLHRLQVFPGWVIYGRFELGRCQGHIPGQLAFPHDLVFSVSIFASPQPVEMAVGSPPSGVLSLCLLNPPLFNLHYFWKPFLVFRGLDFCWHLVSMKMYFMLLLFFSYCCGQFQEKKREMMTFMPPRQTSWLYWNMGCTSQFCWGPVLCNEIAPCHKALNAGNDVISIQSIGSHCTGRIC